MPFAPPGSALWQDRHFLEDLFAAGDVECRDEFGRVDGDDGGVVDGCGVELHFGDVARFELVLGHDDFGDRAHADEGERRGEHCACDFVEAEFVHGKCVLLWRESRAFGLHLGNLRALANHYCLRHCYAWGMNGGLKMFQDMTL